MLLLMLATWLGSSGPDPTHWLTGAAVPALSLTTLEGEPATPPGKGQDHVLVLWAGWCGPCVAELPLLAETMKRTAGGHRPVALVSIDEDPAVARRALKRAARKPPTWTVLWGGPEAGGTLGVRTVPTAFVLASDGTIASVWTGHQDRAAWTTILSP